MNIEIANKLQQMRKKNNLSQEELAAKLGVTRQAVSKWERAESAPDMENLILLAKLYGVSIDELLNVEDAPDASNSGISLKKDDYGFTDDPVREIRPENYTDEEIYPNASMESSNSIPQGAPFGVDINDEEKKSTGADTAQDDLIKNLEKAGRAIGDVINSAGQKLGETIKKAEDNSHKADGTTADWEVKLEHGMHKFEKGMEKFGASMEQVGKKLDDKLGNAFGEEDADPRMQKHSATLLDKLFPILMVIVFCLSIPLGLAHIGWLAFLFIPMYYTTKAAVKNRNPLIFCYPVFCVIVYVGIGIICNDWWLIGDFWWGTMWMIFLTIPIYYIVFAHYYSKKKNK